MTSTALIRPSEIRAGAALIEQAIRHAIHIESVDRIERGERDVLIHCHNTGSLLDFHVDYITSCHSYAVGKAANGEPYAVCLPQRGQEKCPCGMEPCECLA